MPRYRTRIICSSATDCSSQQRGLCPVPLGACYALRAERRFPRVLPYRRRQTDIWDQLSAAEIAEDVKVLARRRRKIPTKYLRMQESGDFRHHGDLAKMSELADLLKGVVTVYTYTARRDLFPARTSSNLIINGSGFMVDNNFKVVNKDQLQVGPKCRGIKGGGCFGCRLCKTKGKKVIQEVLRGSVKPVGDGKGGVPQNPEDTGDLFVEEGLIEVFSPATSTPSGTLSRGRVTREPKIVASEVRGLR